MNNFKIEIREKVKDDTISVINRPSEWVDYTKKAVFPLKFGDLLDERLDEGYITLKNLKREQPFTPLSFIRVTITNTPEALYLVDGKMQRKTEEITKYFFVAIDKVNEYPVGSERYTHDIYFIEITKLSERFMCESITFTNALGNIYTENS